MDHTVLFLILAGKLMFLDLALCVVISMGAHYESVLGTSLHCLCIYIIVWLVILYEPSLLLPCLEVLDSLVICRLAVLVDDRVEIDFRLGDVEEGFLSSLSLCLY